MKAAHDDLSHQLLDTELLQGTVSVLSALLRGDLTLGNSFPLKVVLTIMRMLV